MSETAFVKLEKIPHSCSSCMLSKIINKDCDEFECIITNKSFSSDTMLKPDWCPIIIKKEKKSKSEKIEELNELKQAIDSVLENKYEKNSKKSITKCLYGEIEKSQKYKYMCSYHSDNFCINNICKSRNTDESNYISVNAVKEPYISENTKNFFIIGINKKSKKEIIAIITKDCNKTMNIEFKNEKAKNDYYTLSIIFEKLKEIL